MFWFDKLHDSVIFKMFFTGTSEYERAYKGAFAVTLFLISLHILLWLLCL